MEREAKRAGPEPEPDPDRKARRRAGSDGPNPVWQALALTQPGACACCGSSGPCLHEGGAAEPVLSALGAQGAALGRHVLLSSRLSGTARRAVLAHELTHARQTGARPGKGETPVSLGAASSAEEREARIAGAIGAPLHPADAAADPAVLRLYDEDQLLRGSITPEWAATLSEAELQRAHIALREHIATLSPGTPEYEAAGNNLRVLEDRVMGGEPASADATEVTVLPGPPDAGAVPSGIAGSSGPQVHVGVTGSGSGGQWSPALVESLLISAGRGAGFVHTPPIRGLSDPLIPRFLRDAGRYGNLGDLPGGGFRLERYVGSEGSRVRVDVRGQLRPRYSGAEGQMLRELEYLRRGGGAGLPAGISGETAAELSRWLDVYDIGQFPVDEFGSSADRNLARVPDLLRRATTEGIGALTNAERQLLTTVVEAHARGNLTTASPLLSGSTRPGVSGIEGIPGTISDRPYIVEIELPEGSGRTDVGTMLAESLDDPDLPEHTRRLLQEGEVVFEGSGGRVTSIRPNPSGFLGRAAPVLRHAGPLAEAAGLGYSGYRIGTATEEERPRVIGEEVGGTAGGWVGSGLGAGICIWGGVASGGWILLGCAIVGGGVLGIGGSYVGGEIGEAAGERERSGAGRRRGERFPLYVCFAAGTPVRMGDGRERAIETLVEGETVASWDESGRRPAVGTVTAVHESRPGAGRTIGLASGIEIAVTERHRFLTSGGWVEARALAPGARCVTAGGGENVVLSNRPGLPEGPVYNLTVAPHATYVAGGVVVHNTK